jgi:hypothetical protein
MGFSLKCFAAGERSVLVLGFPSHDLIKREVREEGGFRLARFGARTELRTHQGLTFWDDLDQSHCARFHCCFSEFRSSFVMIFKPSLVQAMAR